MLQRFQSTNLDCGSSSPIVGIFRDDELAVRKGKKDQSKKKRKEIDMIRRKGDFEEEREQGERIHSKENY